MAGVNDGFRQGGIAAGVAAFGALVPAAAALGHGVAGSYVSGLREALWIRAGVAALSAAATALLLQVQAGREEAESPFASVDAVSELA